MKLHITAVLLLMIISSGIFAQDCCDKCNEHEHQQKIDMKGKLGLYLFSNSDFTPNNFIGGTIGAKYFITRNIAIRGGLSYNNTSFGLQRPRFGENNQQFNDENNPENDSAGHGGRGTSFSTFGASAYAMYYPLSLGKFTFYAGAGALYHFYTTTAHLIVNGTTVSNVREQRFGVGALAGAEYRLLRKLNLSLEYNPTFLFDGKRNEIENQQTGTTITVRGQRNFNASNVNLGVVYYFN